MNEQLILNDIAHKLLERWKLVIAESRKANESQHEYRHSLYQQERRFLEDLLEQISQHLPDGLTEWAQYKQHPAPNIYFSPDSTDVEPGM
ncbi:hypothetical protein [Spirosoma koreense]